MLRSSLFVVRVWRKDGRGGLAGFRASVRAVNAEHSRVFTRPADLARYLLRHCPQALPARRSSIVGQKATS